MFTLWPLANVQHEMNRLQQEMNHLFGGNENQRSAVNAGYPPLNLWHNDDQYVVEAEMPGLELDDLEILVVDGNQLTISGERKLPQVENGSWHRREMSYGRFQRTIELPSNVDADQVSASLKNGVLSVVLPKLEKQKPKRITVKSS